MSSFLWALVFFLFLWLGMRSVGVGSAESFIFAALAGFGIFFFIRLLGDRPAPEPED